MRIEILEQQHDLLRYCLYSSGKTNGLLIAIISNKEREMEQELRQLQAIISQMDRETEELDLDIKQSKQEVIKREQLHDISCALINLLIVSAVSGRNIICN
jgi:hypothetical protein